MIVPVGNTPDPRGAREHLLQNYRLDYTSLLTLTLDLWDALDVETPDVLDAALEDRLFCLLQNVRHKRTRQRIMEMDFRDFAQTKGEVLHAIQSFYVRLQRPLAPLMSERPPGMAVDVRLVGWVDGGAVLEFVPRSA